MGSPGIEHQSPGLGQTLYTLGQSQNYETLRLFKLSFTDIL